MDQKLRLVWKAYLAGPAAMQMAEHPCEAVVAERLREYLCNRLTEATQSSVRKLLLWLCRLGRNY